MENNISLKLAFYGGAGIGLLFGVLMGTSVTPTVGTMIGALTTLLAAILGLNDQHFNNAKSVRVGSFGFACVVGAYLGLFVRSHNLLSPSLISLKAEYIALGFSENQALNFISQKEFGVATNSANQSAFQISPAQPDEVLDSDINTESAVTTTRTETNTTTSNTEVNSIVAKQHSSVLFSAPVELSGCYELAYTDDTLPLDEVINNFELTGDAWEQLVIEVTDNFRTEKQMSLLLITKEAVCKVENVQESSCQSLAGEFEKSSYQDILTAMNNQSANWNMVASYIDSSGLASDEKLISLRLAKNILCGK